MDMYKRYKMIWNTGNQYHDRKEGDGKGWKITWGTEQWNAGYLKKYSSDYKRLQPWTEQRYETKVELCRK